MTPALSTNFEFWISRQSGIHSQAVHARRRRSPELAMNQRAFSGLLELVQHSDTVEAKLAVIGRAARTEYFTAAQARLLVRCFSYDGQRLSALHKLADRIVDPRNSNGILNEFTFDINVYEAERILGFR